MKTSPLRAAALAAAGAALLGGGMFLGFVSALVKRKEWEGTGAAPAGAPDAGYSQRVDQLAAAVVELQKRVDRGVGSVAVPAPEETGEQLEAVSRRIERLEQRLEQLAFGTPPTEDVLDAVERMIENRIGGLDKRLKDQVQQIEMLRHASTQTDVLLQRLIAAVESLGRQGGEKPPPGPEDGPEGPRPGGAPPDYPLA